MHIPEFAARSAFVFADGDGIVVRRTGLLALWIPEPGTGLFDCPALFGMQAHIEDVVRDRGRREVIADIRMRSPVRDVLLDLIFEKMDDGFVRLTIRDVSERHRRVSALAQRERSARIAAEIAAQGASRSIRAAGACRTP